MHARGGRSPRPPSFSRTGCETIPVTGTIKILEVLDTLRDAAEGPDACSFLSVVVPTHPNAFTY